MGAGIFCAGVDHGCWLEGQPGRFLPWTFLHLGRAGAGLQPGKGNKELTKGSGYLKKGKKKKQLLKG